VSDRTLCAVSLIGGKIFKYHHEGDNSNERPAELWVQMTDGRTAIISTKTDDLTMELMEGD